MSETTALARAPKRKARKKLDAGTKLQRPHRQPENGCLGQPEGPAERHADGCVEALILAIGLDLSRSQEAYRNEGISQICVGHARMPKLSTAVAWHVARTARSGPARERSKPLGNERGRLTIRPQVFGQRPRIGRLIVGFASDLARTGFKRPDAGRQFCAFWRGETVDGRLRSPPGSSCLFIGNTPGFTSHVLVATQADALVVARFGDFVDVAFVGSFMELLLELMAKCCFDPFLLLNGPRRRAGRRVFASPAPSEQQRDEDRKSKHVRYLDGRCMEGAYLSTPSATVSGASAPVSWQPRRLQNRARSPRKARRRDPAP